MKNPGHEVVIEGGKNEPGTMVYKTYNEVVNKMKTNGKSEKNEV